jgi:hypothetical protein
MFRLPEQMPGYKKLLIAVPSAQKKTGAQLKNRRKFSAFKILHPYLYFYFQAVI